MAKSKRKTEAQKEREAAADALCAALNKSAKRKGA